ncbi:MULTISPECIES: YrhK family protein [unclassified Brachybacterium]|uniref:YrhK family protein n=1 Tax=unclassified Brachybacterium TaxID=2623841 RepID=UPI00361DDFE6
MGHQQDQGDAALELRIGRHELELSNRYEAASIANDVLIGLWFIIGSICFFSEQLMSLGTWLFLIGSIQMTIRPAIRLARRVHLRRIGAGSAHSMDF